MINIGSKLNIVDNSGASEAKCIHIINKSNKKVGFIGDIILITLRKFFNKKKVKKKIIYIGLIIGLSYWLHRLDGTLIKFFSNCILLFNKQFKFLGTRVYGIILKEVKILNLKEKKRKTYFSKIITYSPFLI